MSSESIRTQDGKVVAKLGNGTLYKTGVTEAKHMLKKPPAWCFDVSMFTNPSKEIHTIVVVTDDTQKEYSVSVEKFFVFAKKIDRGHNLQYMLPLQYWTIKGKGREAEQLRLFNQQPTVVRDFASKMPNLMEQQMGSNWNKKNRRTRRNKNAKKSKDNTG